jgi:thiosulfate/3-mercaptopyruvate sulfurtransferase
MKTSTHQPLVSTQWLSHNLDHHQLQLIDASWHLPTSKRDGYAEYCQAHIPGAVFFDHDKVCDTKAKSPHMAPSEATFKKWMSVNGINANDHIVIYDCVGLFSAARLWWLFNLMGINTVSVLDGGFPKWLDEGRKTTHTVTDVKPTTKVTCNLQPIMKSAGQVEASLETNRFQIVDARAPGRFLGSQPEPREGLRSGHIPGSKNVFFKSLLEANQTMKEPLQIEQVFLTAGVDLSMPIITSCGSGVTAAIVNLALTVIGKTDHYLYDGSWAEWGMGDQRPVSVAHDYSS